MLICYNRIYCKYIHQYDPPRTKRHTMNRKIGVYNHRLYGIANLELHGHKA